MSQINPVDTIAAYFFDISFNTILKLRLWIQSGPFLPLFDFTLYAVTSVTKRLSVHRPRGPIPSDCWGSKITSRHTVLLSTRLDEWSARRKDLYLTTHNYHNRQTSMPLRDSNPKSQQTNSCRPVPYIARLRESVAFIYLQICNIFLVYLFRGPYFMYSFSGALFHYWRHCLWCNKCTNYLHYKNVYIYATVILQSLQFIMCRSCWITQINTCPHVLLTEHFKEYW